LPTSPWKLAKRKADPYLQQNLTPEIVKELNRLLVGMVDGELKIVFREGRIFTVLVGDSYRPVPTRPKRVSRDDVQ
jgi:hypothetical protein